MVKKTPVRVAKKTKKKITNKAVSGWFVPPRKPTTADDLKTAALLVSLTINLAFFIFWLILRLTDVYDVEVQNFLFNR